MGEFQDYEYIQSDALTKNLDITKVKVEVPRFFEILEKAVEGYAGKEQQAHELLVEYHHTYRNWAFVIQETWRYAISNMRLYSRHPLNGSVIYLLSHIFMEAIRQSHRAEIRGPATDHLLAFWIKLAEEMPEEIARPMPEGTTLENLSRTVAKSTGCHEGILRYFIGEMGKLPDVPFEYVLRSYYQPRQLAGRLLEVFSDPSSFEEIRRLLQRQYQATYLFWLSREDPCQWLMAQRGDSGPPPWGDLCSPVGHERFERHMCTLKSEIEPERDHRKAVEKMMEMVDFYEIVRFYYKLPDKLKSYDAEDGDSQLSLIMRFKIMETRGLEGIHEDTLREINFDIAKWIRREKRQGSLQAFLDRVLDVIAVCFRNYPEAALQIIRTMGLEILETDDRKIIDYFIRRIIRMGFQTPQLGGVSQHWQIAVNPAHLPNVRVWLDIIRKNPIRTKMLLSGLILELSLGGIYVRDTDLFQRDVSELLHTPVRPVYNLIKQLAKLFPVYFNQIGAEGQLRTVSTEVDELTGRSDRLIHFLRKQSHVESNNIVVLFIEAIIDFWRTLDKSRLKDLLPAEVYPEIASSGPMVDEVHRIFSRVFECRTIHHVQDLLDVSEQDIHSMIWGTPDVSDREKQRTFLLVQFYQLLHEKYALSFKDIHLHLQRAAGLGLPDPSALLSALESRDAIWKLNAILDYLTELQEVILTPGELNVLENIYLKRHIAVDIPSMYGSYNERKFDALGLTFRLENLANVLFEEIILSFNLSFITRATFIRIAGFLRLFIKALAIDGITSNRLERQLELFERALQIPRFSHSQYMDIFRGFSEAIKQIIQTNYHAIHEENLDVIIKQMGQEYLLPRYRREMNSESVGDWNQRVSESFLRDIIARTFGLQYFDHFVGSILTTLATQKEELNTEKLDLLLSYDPDLTLSQVHAPHPETYDLIHMGNKGYTLAKLHNIGIQVPPAFVITTEYFRCQSVIECFHQSAQDFEDRVMDHVHKLEEATGRRFGHPDNPLLLSVRSGAAVSMPGMMNTFLNVGINEDVVEGLIRQTGEAWFAWDNYRRFIQSWAMSYGMQRDEFDAIMDSHKKSHGRLVKREFTPLEMKELALAYRDALKSSGIEYSDSPKDQLFTAIRQVMESWESPKAKMYRSIMMLSENWGTAVTIQAMVFGNLDNRSGAGVLFTHNPKTSEDQVDPVGDFTLGNQGEDVVGGLVKTLPITEKQRLEEGERSAYSLERLFPSVYQRLLRIAKELIYGQSWSPQEIEFTFQGDEESGVYVLQSRDMAPRVKRHYPVFKLSEQLNASYAGSGIGVSGGALSGLVAFDFETIQQLRADHVGRPIILIRSDTVPDDIREISITDGILTGKGGATSHAAIVALRLGKVCVVGFTKLKVWESERKCTIDGHTLHSGDSISIDGRSGGIYVGHHETEQVDVLS
ncbi:MAG: PEP/pyruvate-binding domain-containing protein [Syntrophobacteraceae bacterium]|nr:hypothetical protein [Desulfobacteraceae bacterium]